MDLVSKWSIPQPQATGYHTKKYTNTHTHTPVSTHTQELCRSHSAHKHQPKVTRLSFQTSGLHEYLTGKLHMATLVQLLSRTRTDGMNRWKHS